MLDSDARGKPTKAARESLHSYAVTMSEEKEKKRQDLVDVLSYLGVHQDDILLLVERDFHLKKDLEYPEMAQPGDLEDWHQGGSSGYEGVSPGGWIKVLRLLTLTLLHQLDNNCHSVSFECWKEGIFLEELREFDKVNAPDSFVINFLDLVCVSVITATYMNIVLGVHDHKTLYSLLPRLENASLDFVPRQKVMAKLLKILPPPDFPKYPKGHGPSGEEVDNLYQHIGPCEMTQYVAFFLTDLGVTEAGMSVLEKEYGVEDYSSLYAQLPCLRKGLLRTRAGLELEVQTKLASKMFLMPSPSSLAEEDPLVDYWKLKNMEWSTETSETEK